MLNLDSVLVDTPNQTALKFFIFYDAVFPAVPAETGCFQENVGTERCLQEGRSLDHQVLPVRPAPTK